MAEPIAESTDRRKIIIDVDTGFDDAHAIMLALSRPDIDVVAITCVNGNVEVDCVTANTMNVLEVCQRMDVPVFRGASQSLLNTVYDERHFVPAWRDVQHVKLKQTEHAANALVRLVNQFKGEITLVALGPLTNVALALHLDTELPKKLRDVVIMGGDADAKGPVGAKSEFNFAVDPEAAYLVLSSMRNILIIPFEVCNRHLLPWEFLEEWTGKNTTKSKFLRDSIENVVRLAKERGFKGISSFDVLAMAAMVDPTVVTEEETVYATVELSGQLRRGHMVVDWFDRLKKEKNVRLIVGVDMTKVQQLLLTMSSS